MFSLEPAFVWLPVVVNVAVSPFTNPVIDPAAFNALPSYGFLASGVVTVKVAGLTTIVPSTFLTFNIEVTSSPTAFLMTNVSQVAATDSFVTSVTDALDSAFSNVYPLGNSLTVTVASWAWPL